MHWWFNGSRKTNKERVRAERARVHAGVSVAGVAAAVAAMAARPGFSDPQMSLAMASATELLASHCMEMATELVGKDGEQLTSAVQSALDVRSAGDLLTLTAAAATGIILLSEWLDRLSQLFLACRCFL